MVGRDSCPELNLTMGFMLAFCYKETPYELHQKNMAKYSIITRIGADVSLYHNNAAYRGLRHEGVDHGVPLLQIVVLSIVSKDYPDVGYYGIFDTETETFLKDIEGANLTWRDDDISTAAYSIWSEIYGYDGNLQLANLRHRR